MPSPLALTLGEPAGIGPDITFAAWRRRAEFGLAPFYLLADPAFVARRAERIAPDVTIAVVEPQAAGTAFETALPVVDIGVTVSAEPGRPDRSSAPAALTAIRRAVADVSTGVASAIVTNPIAKNVLYRSGFAEPGHTEYLGKLVEEATGVAVRPVMMLWSPELAVVPVTIHLALKEVVARLTTDLIVETGRIVARDLRDRFDIARPRHRYCRSQSACGRRWRARRRGSERGAARRRAPRDPKASMCADRCRPTRCFTKRHGRATTWRLRCITTRL